MTEEKKAPVPENPVEQTDETSTDEPSTTEVTDTPNLDSYPGVPSDVLESIKEKYPIIFGTYFNDKPVLYKMFTSDEYLAYQEDALAASEKIQSDNDALPVDQRIPDQEIAEMVAQHADELLVSTFTVYPENIVEKVKEGEYPGGCIYSLTQAILVNSGFVDLEPMLLTKADVDSDDQIIPSLEKELLPLVDDLTGTDIRNMVNEHKEILLTWFLNKLYIVRGFTYNEYAEIRRLSTTLDPSHLSIELVNRFLVHPDPLEVDAIPAGLVFKVLSDGILSISGFTNPNPDILIME